VSAAITGAGAFGAPTLLVHATAASLDAPAPTITTVDMGAPVTTSNLAVVDPALVSVATAAGNPVKGQDDDGDIDAGCGLGNDADRDHDCKTGEGTSTSSSTSEHGCNSDSDHDGDKDCGSSTGNDEDEDDEANDHHCDGDGDHDDNGCTSSSSSSSSSSTTKSTTSSGGAEDVCETSGLAGPTIGDQLVDAGLPLNEPEANGPISGALVSSSDPLEGTPLAPVVNEVACVANLLTL
jgi:hypothetical protein